jgi:glutamyl-tRNA synthetase
MRISHVIRADEYLTSTPKYVLLYRAFGWDTPLFVHLPMILSSEHPGKLSKRKGDPSVMDFLGMGYLPQTIVNYAAFLGWSPPGEREIYSLDELADVFEIKHISKAPSKCDLVKMAWMNGEHIKLMSPDAFYGMAVSTLLTAVRTPGIDLNMVAGMVQPRIQFLSDIHELVDFIDAPPEYDIELFTHKKMKTDAATALAALEAVAPLLETFEDWSNDALYAALSAKAEGLGFKNSQILWPLRTALSGKPSSPCGATELCVLLGRDESLKRLRAGIQKLSNP